ncbi:MAG TPA: hypothetical protein VH436_28805 [Vicinamibacterales bacterium]
MSVATDRGQPYEAQWRSYRWWRRLTIGLWLGWIPFGVLAFGIVGPIAPPRVVYGMALTGLASRRLAHDSGE